jgi:hypothetical protein
MEVCSTGMRRLVWFLVIFCLYALHQDVWYWTQARPLVFGFLPVGLAYHAAYCVAVAVLMWALTRLAWPADLEVHPSGGPGPGTRSGAAGSTPHRA